MTETRFPAIGEQLKALARGAPGTWLVWLFLVTGCDRGVPLGRVEGAVRFQGQPVRSASVLFEGRANAVNMSAPTNENGEFRVSMDKGFGLPLGEYAVSVQPVVLELPTPQNPTPWVGAGKDIPDRYRKPETSGLRLIVKEGDNPLSIEMTP